MRPKRRRKPRQQVGMLPSIRRRQKVSRQRRRSPQRPRWDSSRRRAQRRYPIRDSYPLNWWGVLGGLVIGGAIGYGIYYAASTMTGAPGGTRGTNLPPSPPTHPSTIIPFASASQQR